VCIHPASNGSTVHSHQLAHAGIASNHRPGAVATNGEVESTTCRQRDTTGGSLSAIPCGASSDSTDRTSFMRLPLLCIRAARAAEFRVDAGSHRCRDQRAEKYRATKAHARKYIWKRHSKGQTIAPPTRLPIARELGETSLMFLVHPTLTDSELDRACAALSSVLVRAGGESLAAR